MSQPRPPNAFSLQELLVVLAVLSILVALLMPALKRTREQSKSLVCLNNLRGIGNGLLLYAADRGTLPYASHYFYWCDWSDTIVPYMNVGQDEAQFHRWTDNDLPQFRDFWVHQGNVVDRSYSQNRWGYFTCPVPPKSMDCKFAHNYACNEYLMPSNHNSQYVGGMPIPGVSLQGLERPSSLIMVADCGIMDPGFPWALNDAPDTIYQAVQPIVTDFVNAPSTAPTRGELPVETPAACNNDTGLGAGWPVYSRHGGVCLAVMADGHVQPFHNGEMKRRNFVSQGRTKRWGGGSPAYVEAHFP